MSTPDPRVALVAEGETGTALPNAYGSWSMFDGFDTAQAARPRTAQVEQAIRSDGKTALLEQALTLPLRGAAWHIEPAPGDTGQTAWVSEQLETPSNAGGMSTPLQLVIGQMAAACWQRQTCFEKVWRPVDGGTRVGYDKLALRPGASVLRDGRTGGFRGISQLVPKIENGRSTGTHTITLDPDRCFVYVHGQHRDPLNGVGDLDVSWLISDTKRKLRFLWWKFLENVSFPSATMQTNATAGDASTLREAAQRAASLRSGGILPLAQGESLMPYDSNGAGASQFQAALDWLSHEQSQSVLAGFADLTGPGKTGGSYALSVSATDLFTGGRDSVLVEMGACLTNYVIADLVKWNFGADAASPTLVFAPLKQTDLQNTVSLLQSLARESADSMVPQSFVDELALKVAGYLELDVEKVRNDLQVGHPIGNGPAALSPTTGQLEVQPGNAPAPVATLATQVEKARQMVLAHDALKAA